MTAGAPTIVIVDDAAEVRLLLKARLRLSGLFRVVGEGADGSEAIELARQHSPALMLLDVSMPGVDGLEALPEILRASPTTRVVLFSGFEEQGLAERAEALGAAAFIEKSTPVDTLVDRLLGLVGRPAAPDDRGDQTEPQPSSSTAEHGRGLHLIGALTTAWGLEIVPGEGKVVWAELARPS